MRSFILALFFVMACSSGDDSGSGNASGGTATDGATAANGSSGNGIDTGSGTSGADGSDATTGIDGSDTGGPVVFKCETDADCDGQLCDCLGRCVPPGVEGLPACVENINCGSGHYCDKCAGVCRALKQLCDPCQESQECDGGACLDFLTGGRFCLRDCLADAGCPQGFSCASVDGTQYDQCKPFSGVCAAPGLCSNDVDCPYGEVCNEGKCGPGCGDDGSCPDGMVCSAFRCTPACSPTNPCAGDQVCTDDGHCKIEGGCLEPKDCLEPETYCDMQTNMCKPGCLQDYDCKASAMMCVDGKCVAKGCAANYFCAFGQICVLDTGKCEPAPGPHCESGCDPQAQNACGGQGNKCLELQDKDGNSAGTYCFVACGPDPLNPCPQGYQCEQLTDEAGTIQAELCLRDCTVNPV